MLKKRIVFALAALLTFTAAGTLWAQGESGAPSLYIQPGARANGLGQAYVAIADDATGIYWNPAGIAFVNRAVDLMHSQLVPDLAADVFYEYFGGSFQVAGFGSVGFSMPYLNYGHWEARDEDNNYLGRFSSWEIAPTISGAVKLNNIGIGMNIKFIYIDLAPKQATVEGQAGRGSSVAVDLGGLWRVPDFSVLGYKVSRLNLGLCVSNLGPSISYINVDQAASLPRNLRLGFAYTPYLSDLGRITVVSDVNRPLVEFERSNTYHAGAEFSYIDLITVRAGYTHDKDGNIMDPTYGLGFSFSKRYRLDWASIPQAKDLGRVHRWSIGFTF